MSDWSDLGLPPFQVSDFGYNVNASLLRTPFESEWPRQSRLNRFNLKTFTATAFLTQHQVFIAETFLRTGAGYTGFTADVLSGPGYGELGVRAREDYQVEGVGADLYRLTLRLETADVAKPATLAWFLAEFDDGVFSAYAEQLRLMCNWQASDAGNYDWVSLAMSQWGSTVYAGTYSNNAVSAIFKSSNGGQHWAGEYDTGSIGVNGVACNAVGDIVFGVSTSGVWRKKDGAWLKLPNVTGRAPTSVAVSSSGQKVITGGTNQLWVSLNYGNDGTWVRKATSGAYKTVACSYTFSRLYAAITNGGLERCTDGVGTSWSSMSPYGGLWYEIRTSGNGMVVLAVAQNLVALSTDGGDTWATPTLFGSNGIRCCAVSGDGNTLVVAQQTAGVNNIFYSRDRGAHWSTCDNTSTILWTSVAVSYDGTIAVGSVNDSKIYFLY